MGKTMGLKKLKLQMTNNFLAWQSCNCTCTNPVFQKSLRKKTAQEKNDQIQKTVVRLEILSGVFVVNTNQGFGRGKDGIRSKFTGCNLVIFCYKEFGKF